MESEVSLDSLQIKSIKMQKNDRPPTQFGKGGDVPYKNKQGKKQYSQRSHTVAWSAALELWP
jgi:hypothetical protein